MVEAKILRTRFAPSPTGYLHVGGARTALYNYLVTQKAKKDGLGEFILRIEDTDEERNRDEWTKGIIESLKWLGIDWDLGPFFQSQRLDLYKESADRLFQNELSYWCDCTREEIDRRNKENSRPPGYDRFCRDRGLDQAPGRVLRFMVPSEGKTTVNDVIRGEVVVENRVIEDFAIMKANNAPLFVLANTIDDIDMEITHVIRGEEHLPNTPKVILLWQALHGKLDSAADSQRALPTFAHLPLLVNEQRQKLSKRRDKVAVEDYRDQGILPEAMVNYLALLGWGPGNDREFLNLQEMIELFDLTKVNLAPAFFDEKKLAHFNGTYIRDLDIDRFTLEARPWLSYPKATWAESDFDLTIWSQVAPLIKERVATFSEIPPMAGFFFLNDVPMDPDAWNKAVAGNEFSLDVLERSLEYYQKCEWDTQVLHLGLSNIADTIGKKLGKIQAPLRVAITGRTVGPPLFESMCILGRGKVVNRIGLAIERVKTGYSPTEPNQSKELEN